MATITNVQFEHYRSPNTLGVHESRPRLSWRFQDAPRGFQQCGYEAELLELCPEAQKSLLETARCSSSHSSLVSWPFEVPLRSRQSVYVRVRAWDEHENFTQWRESPQLEIGLLNRIDWDCGRITAPWATKSSGPTPEHLYKKDFTIMGPVSKARLYVTAQGVYEVEINRHRVGDYFMAPGWTAYDHRLNYQTYDVTSALSRGRNCLGVRVAEGWFCGRIGFEGGHRNIWGPHVALMAQLEILYSSGRLEKVCTDGSWLVAEGPIRRAEIYDGEIYDARLEVGSWSISTADDARGSDWCVARAMAPLPNSIDLTAGFGEPVRRVETIKPIGLIQTPSGKTVVDFGQNIVGYVRLKNIRGPRGHKIRLSHAEVLENGELCTRPLRICKATDEYILRGAENGEHYEPRFTFHGFRYAQIDGWSLDLASIEAVVCHTDMKSAGSFSCSDDLLNKLYRNIRWGMRGNFFSVPTDCPQRDERLGWSGDLAIFAPTAVLIYDCFGMLKNWLIDLEHDQRVLGGVPPMVSPNATLPDPVWCRRIPCAIWHDVTILAPWALYQETADVSILAQQYNSMLTWMQSLPRNKSGATHLWDTNVFQLGDWLDPAAPPDRPWESASDAKMIANMFLIHSLDLMIEICGILNDETKKTGFQQEAEAARAEFHQEYVTPNGRLVSDTQAAYAVAICFNIIHPAQRVRAGEKLVELVRKKGFKITTGFAGTPFVCEALAATGNIQVAYAMLLEKNCPSWLYPVTMGATTVWERWDSMLPDGSINPGEMTSFNHYAFGAIAKFMYERIAGLQRLEPGWRSFRVAPAIGAEFSHASASHVTANGTISTCWKTAAREDGMEIMDLSVSVPHNVTAEVVLPAVEGDKEETVGPGQWSFQTRFKRDKGWPVLPLKPKS